MPSFSRNGWVHKFYCLKALIALEQVNTLEVEKKKKSLGVPPCSRKQVAPKYRDNSFDVTDPLPPFHQENWSRLSILWRIMEIEEGVTASTDNTLRDLHNSSYDTKAEFNNCFIIHSKLFLVHLKFIFDLHLVDKFKNLSSSANILQIAEVVLRVVFLLFLPCF